ncbi:MAG: hypothetical protein HYU29_09410 [Chloroflexi bacterium]|nr:hypothetical protein [Chloroflexota bacterium]
MAGNRARQAGVGVIVTLGVTPRTSYKSLEQALGEKTLENLERMTGPLREIGEALG